MNLLFIPENDNCIPFSIRNFKLLSLTKVIDWFYWILWKKKQYLTVYLTYIYKWNGFITIGLLLIYFVLFPVKRCFFFLFPKLVSTLINSQDFVFLNLNSLLKSSIASAMHFLRIKWARSLNEFQIKMKTTTELKAAILMIVE